MDYRFAIAAARASMEALRESAQRSQEARRRTTHTRKKVEETRKLALEQSTRFSGTPSGHPYPGGEHGGTAAGQARKNSLHRPFNAAR